MRPTISLAWPPALYTVSTRADREPVRRASRFRTDGRTWGGSPPSLHSAPRPAAWAYQGPSACPEGELSACWPPRPQALAEPLARELRRIESIADIQRQRRRRACRNGPRFSYVRRIGGYRCLAPLPSRR